MRRLRQSIVLAMLLATAPAAVKATQAEEIGGNVETGRALAGAWCAQCHRIERDRFPTFTTDFIDVANLPSTTALSLLVFLQSCQKQMPNFSLKPAETDDIIAYILSLKRQ
jgi:mono/diheme cytochrome c family protein